MKTNYRHRASVPTEETPLKTILSVATAAKRLPRAALLGLLAAGLIAAPLPAQTIPVTNPLIFKSISERINPPLIQAASDSNFYGTTNEGGEFGRGSIVQIGVRGERTVVYSFPGKDDAGGTFPLYGLTKQDNGFVYGVTTRGGETDAGTLFRFSTALGFELVLSFNPVGTGYPLGLWAVGTNGSVYGLTGDRNPNDPASGDPITVTLRRYNNSTLSELGSVFTGILPVNGVSIDRNGDLYGYSTDGTNVRIWKYSIVGNVLNKSFATLPNGCRPIGVPFFLTNNTLRGVFQTNASGVIFEASAAGVVTTKVTFNFATQGQPEFRANYPANIDAGRFNWSPDTDTADNLYGANAIGGSFSSGTIWKLPASGTGFTVLNNVDPALQLSEVISTVVASGDNLFATANTASPTPDRGAFLSAATNGSLVANVLNPSASVAADKTLIYESIGGNPNRFLARGSGNDGNVYGTTNIGGRNNRGILFRANSAGQVLNLFDFGGSSEIEYPEEGLIALSDGYLYGVGYGGQGGSQGVVFRYKPGEGLDPAVFATIPDASGNGLNLPIRASTGNFYLTTKYSGTNFDGQLVRINTTGQVDLSLPSFSATANGSQPDGPLLIGSDGNFYGVCQFGGVNGFGTVFSATATGSSITRLASFSYGTTGAYPVGPLVENVDAATRLSSLYGVTQFSGGPENQFSGLVFRVSLSGASTIVTAARSFTSSTGYFAQAGMIKGSDGNLYGLTGIAGSGDGGGSLYKFIPSNSSLTALAALNTVSNGSYGGSPVEQVDGSLLAACNDGGTFTDGTLVKFAGVFPVQSAPVITSAGSASGKPGQTFSYQITATENPNSFGAAPLPPGLSLDATSGLISGNPTTLGTTSVTISASNSTLQVGQKTIQIIITNDNAPSLASGQTATGIQGQNFTYQVLANNSPTSFVSVDLPSGLSINNFGLITGLPFVTGTTQASVTATNNGGSDTKTISITIIPNSFEPPKDSSSKTLPILKVKKAPKKTTKKILKIGGSATSPNQITQVVATLNNKRVSVKGTNTWSTTLRLKPGVNTFKVYTVDAFGNKSAVTTSKINL